MLFRSMESSWYLLTLLNDQTSLIVYRCRAVSSEGDVLLISHAGSEAVEIQLFSIIGC